MWYAASLLFQYCHPNDPEPESLWENSIVLIEASTEETARRIAEGIGADAQCEYVADSDIVQVRFEQIEKIYQIEAEQLVSGTELFSRLLRASEVKSMLTPFDD
jgi:Domain of unknown function (DUF4288)